MKNPDHLSPRDIELLSAYLDGECSSKEAANVEARLKIEPVLHQTLEELRTTAGLLRALPEVPPPRSFALSAEMVGIKPRRPYPVLRLATALASIAFVALIGLDGLTTLLTPLVGSVASAVDMRQVGVLEEEAAEAPMMGAEPGVAPAEGSGIADEGDDFFGEEPEATDWLQMTPEPDIQAAPPFAEGSGRGDEFDGQTEADETPCLTPTNPCKTSGTPGPDASTDLPGINEGEAFADVEPTEVETEHRLRELDWPYWRIGLRAGEVAFGAAALLLASLMLWTRRK